MSESFVNDLNGNERTVRERFKWKLMNFLRPISFKIMMKIEDDDDDNDDDLFKNNLIQMNPSQMIQQTIQSEFIGLNRKSFSELLNMCEMILFVHG